jgi:hypothetical protein
MVEGKMTVLALLDFRKAFDHSLFLYKLVSSFDFHGSARYMVSSFLFDRSMVFEMDSLRSSSRAFFLVCFRARYLHHYFLLCLPKLSVRMNFSAYRGP